MVGIKEIARRAGTSIATVSHVLNNTRPVSPALRARVNSAISELGYQPNLLARSLRSKRTGIIGLLVSDFLNPFYTEVAYAVQEEAKKSGYQIIIGNTLENPKTQEEQLDILHRYRVDGAIVAPTPDTDPDNSLLYKLDMPVVLINRRLPNNVWPVVYADNTSATRQVVEHFIRAGRTIIAMLLTMPGVSHNDDRIQGLRHALAEYRFVFDEDLIRYGGLTAEENHISALELFRSRKDIQAVFCASDAAVIGVLRAAKELGIDIPEDIALIGSGNTAWASVYKPMLTHITQPTHEMGIQAFRILHNLIRMRNEGEETILDVSRRNYTILPVGFVHGESCGCSSL